MLTVGTLKQKKLLILDVCEKILIQKVHHWTAQKLGIVISRKSASKTETDCLKRSESRISDTIRLWKRTFIWIV